MSKIRVILWGYGAMGQGVAKHMAGLSLFDIVGVCDIDPLLVGKDAFEVININRSFVKVNDNIDELLKSVEADIVVLTTDSFTVDNAPKIIKCLESNLNVITSAEQMAYPQAQHPELAERIHQTALKHNVKVLGTGINPGFMMDVLAVALTGTSRTIEEIHCRRVNSLSPFGKTVMEEQGIGITLEEFNNRKKDHSLAGHVGFIESAHLIANALGSDIKSFSETMEPIVTQIDRQSPYGFAAKGHIAGIDMNAEVVLQNGIKITFEHPQQIEPQLEGIETGDYIKITGNPNISLAIQPEVDGGVGTISMCVNMIPLLLSANAGLKTMLDLPIPRAIT